MPVLYDFLAPAYDLVFERIYRPFRKLAIGRLPEMNGSCILDLACGTGQNFQLLFERVGRSGHIIGVDVSSGMLRKAASRVVEAKVSLIQSDAAKLTPALLEQKAGVPAVDFIVCTYGFTTMRKWRSAFEASWPLLRPGGVYLMHDIAAKKLTPHVRAIELLTRCNFRERTWELLQSNSDDFLMDYIDPSAHLFGGRLFVALGTKPSTPCRHGPFD